MYTCYILYLKGHGQRAVAVAERSGGREVWPVWGAEETEIWRELSFSHKSTQSKLTMNNEKK